MPNLYDLVTKNKPPKWLGDAGDKAYEGMDNAFKYIGKKVKKKKKQTTAERDETSKNSLDDIG